MLRIWMGICETFYCTFPYATRRSFLPSSRSFWSCALQSACVQVHHFSAWCSIFCMRFAPSFIHRPPSPLLSRPSIGYSAAAWENLVDPIMCSSRKTCPVALVCNRFDIGDPIWGWLIVATTRRGNKMHCDGMQLWIIIYRGDRRVCLSVCRRIMW